MEGTKLTTTPNCRATGRSRDPSPAFTFVRRDHTLVSYPPGTTYGPMNGMGPIGPNKMRTPRVGAANSAKIKAGIDGGPHFDTCTIIRDRASRIDVRAE